MGLIQSDILEKNYVKNFHQYNFFVFRWAKASGAVKAAYQAKSDKDKARYAAEKAKFVAKKQIV